MMVAINAANARDPTAFATMNAEGGIGLARLTAIQPWPRSVATPTPNAKSAAPVAPNAPYEARRYRAGA